MKVVFFNHWHNGDVHVSRTFVRKIMEKLSSLDPQITFSYSHKNDPGLLKDIPNLVFDPNGVHQIGMHDNTVKRGDTLYINTWYAQQNYKFMNIYGISFDTLYAIFDDTCKNTWGFSLSDISSDPSDFFPVIDYERFNIENAKSWINQYPGKKIFVSNGVALSSQAHNFSLTSIINELSKKHTDKIFILSNYDGIPGSANIIHSSDIIRKVGNDLNENAYIASHCDVIIGKASGAFSFAVTKENCLQKSLKFLTFCNLVPSYPNKFWLGDYLKDRINYTSQFIVSNDSDIHTISSIIDSNL